MGGNRFFLPNCLGCSKYICGTFLFNFPSFVQIVFELQQFGVVQLRHLQLRQLLWLQLHHIHILHRGWGLSCLILVAGVPSSSAILVAPSSPSSSSSWRWRCWPCTVGGAPFSIGLPTSSATTPTHHASGWWWPASPSTGSRLCGWWCSARGWSSDSPSGAYFGQHGIYRGCSDCHNQCLLSKGFGIGGDGGKD